MKLLTIAILCVAVHSDVFDDLRAKCKESMENIPRMTFAENVAGEAPIDKTLRELEEKKKRTGMKYGC